MEAPSVCCKPFFILLFLITVLFYLGEQGIEDRWRTPVPPKTPPAPSPPRTPTTPSPPAPAAPVPPSRNLTILLWHWPFGVPYGLEGDVCWDRYRIPGCRLTDRRSLYPAADAVVFHNRELMNGRQRLPLHLPRPPCQRWVWLSLESPSNNGVANLRRYAGLFNWTMSYRRDADVTVPYGELVRRDAAEGRQGGDGTGTTSAAAVVVTSADAVPKEREGEKKKKSPLACWVVSNYNPRHRRSQVYESLRKTIPVEVFGRWGGNNKAGQGRGRGGGLAPRDLLPTISRCYFYLAFENSISRDYITEKLWRNAYQAGAVPVVLGPPPGDYEAVAPPGSFIHVGEFASAEALGRFLRELALDKERYEGYLAWRRSYRVKLYTDWRERLCRICPRYHSLPQNKAYHDLEAWVNQ